MLNLFLRRATVAGASALAIGFASPAALACSTCKCGDYTITLFGTEKAYDGRLRVGLDYLYRSETAGAAGPTAHRRRLRRLHDRRRGDGNDRRAGDRGNLGAGAGNAKGFRVGDPIRRGRG